MIRENGVVCCNERQWRCVFGQERMELCVVMRDNGDVCCDKREWSCVVMRDNGDVCCDKREWSCVVMRDNGDVCCGEGDNEDVCRNERDNGGMCCNGFICVCCRTLNALPDGPVQDDLDGYFFTFSNVFPELHNMYFIIVAKAWIRWTSTR